MSNTQLVETRRCFHCGNKGVLELPMDGIAKYENGALVQDAFPELDRELREQIISGTHPECWKAMFNSLGVVVDDAVLCQACGQFADGDEATREGYPDGFTCADCGVVIH